jgi:uncharacterized protein YlzI (FlbEa/FlbD family)
MTKSQLSNSFDSKPAQHFEECIVIFEDNKIEPTYTALNLLILPSGKNEITIKDATTIQNIKNNKIKQISSKNTKNTKNLFFCNFESDIVVDKNVINTKQFKTTDIEVDFLAKYYIIPLTNFIVYDESNSFKNPIKFQFNGFDCWIEPLPDYDKKKEELLSGKSQQLITAIVVQEFGDSEKLNIKYNGNRNQIDLIPLEIVEILGFISGSQVQPPWSEFRNSNYEVIERIYNYIYLFPFEEGHIIMNIDSKETNQKCNKAISSLLEQSLLSGKLNESYMRVCLRLLIKAGHINLFLEDRKIYTVRCFEIILKQYKCDIKNLTEGLNDHQINNIQSAIDKATAEIQLINGNEKQKESINKIIDRIKTARQKGDQFGMSVCKLLANNNFQFQDEKIIDNFYKTNPRPDKQNFAKVLSNYRGAVIHEGYFDFNNKYNFKDVVIFLNHLHDILIRILLTELGYCGQYNSPITTPDSIKLTDWVNPNTSAEELGYPNE